MLILRPPSWGSIGARYEPDSSLGDSWRGATVDFGRPAGTGERDLDSGRISWFQSVDVTGDASTPDPAFANAVYARLTLLAGQGLLEEDTWPSLQIAVQQVATSGSYGVIDPETTRAVVYRRPPGAGLRRGGMVSGYRSWASIGNADRSRREPHGVAPGIQLRRLPPAGLHALDRGQPPVTEEHHGPVR